MVNLKQKIATFLSAAVVASCSVSGSPAKPSYEAVPRPHYLSSLPSSAKMRAMSSADRFAEELTQIFIGGNTEPDANTIITNKTPKAIFKIDGREVVLELPLYRDEGENLRYIVDGTLHSRSAIVHDLKTALEEAVNEAYGMFSSMPEKVNSRKDRVFGPHANLLKNFNIHGTTLTFGNVYNYMTLGKKDFVPEKYFFAPVMFGIAGVTLLEKERILYAPLGRVIDELYGKKAVLVHELIHKNPKLQNIAWASESNPELYAYLAELTLIPDEIWTFTLHPYGSPLRSLAKEYMGVDIVKLLRESIESSFLMYIEMDPKKLKSMSEKSALLARTFRDIVHNEAYPEELAFPHWWVAATSYTKNPNLALEVETAKKFIPTLLAKEDVKKLLTLKKDALEKVIVETMSKYKPPVVGHFGPFMMMSGPDFKTFFISNAVKAGFNSKDAKFAYNYFLYTNLLKCDGSVNYSWLPLANTRKALQDLKESFAEFLEETKSKKDVKIDGLKMDAALLEWAVKRVSSAENYQKMGELTGVKYSGMFDIRLLDPRWDLDDIYPDLIPRHAVKPNPEALVSESLVRVKDGLEVLVRRYDSLPELGFAAGEDVITATLLKDGKPAPKPSVVFYVSGATEDETSIVEGILVVDSDNLHKLGYGDFDYASMASVSNEGEIDAKILAALSSLDVKKEEKKAPEAKKVEAKLILPKDGIADLADTDMDGVEDSLQVISTEPGRVVISYYKLLDRASHSNFSDSLLVDDLGVVRFTKKGIEKITIDEIKRENPFMVRVVSDREMKTLVDVNLDGVFDYEL